MDDVHIELEKAVAKLKIPRIANAGRNAFEHLRRAWSLHPIDSNMSLFCAITAEEEAATAVIRALQHRRYPQSDLLKGSNHPHKAAVWLVIQALQDMLVDKDIPIPQAMLRKEGEPRVDFHFDLSARGAAPEPIWAKPDEPFNFVLRSDYRGPFDIHDFGREFAAIAEKVGKNSIFELMKAEGNLRNRVLYASEDGIPRAEFADDLILARRRRVCALVFVVIGIMQTDEHQHFLVQCLDILVRIVAKYRGEMPSLPTLEVGQPRIVITDQPDGSRRLSHDSGSAAYSFTQSFAPRDDGLWRWDRPQLTPSNKGLWSS
jgi:hypothetical protein